MFTSLPVAETAERRQSGQQDCTTKTSTNSPPRPSSLRFLPVRIVTSSPGQAAGHDDGIITATCRTGFLPFSSSLFSAIKPFFLLRARASCVLPQIVRYRTFPVRLHHRVTHQGPFTSPRLRITPPEKMDSDIMEDSVFNDLEDESDAYSPEAVRSSQPVPRCGLFRHNAIL